MPRQIAAALAFFFLWAVQLRASGQLELSVIDHDTGQPIAVRMHLKNAQGRPVKPPGVPSLGDHFVFYDKILLRLGNGSYEFLIERGTEYLEQRGHFEIENFADDKKTVQMQRFVDMSKDGWFSGDFDVDRPQKEIQLLMQADDVHVVPLITWSNKQNPWATQPAPKTILNQFDTTYFDSLMGGELTAPGTTLRVFRIDRPLNLSQPSPSGRGQVENSPRRGEGGSLPSPLAGEGPGVRGSAPWKAGDGIDSATQQKFSAALGSLQWLPAIELARREQNAWVDAGAFFARDLPIWIAAGQIDSIQLANRHLEREGNIDNEAGGWPRDTLLFPKPWGNGRWSQELYYHLLNCGLRIPPTAGSGSGANNNPVGYNRFYVNISNPSATQRNYSTDPSADSASMESTNASKQDKPDAENPMTWDCWWEALRAGRVIVTNGPLIRPSVQGQPPGYVFKSDVGQPIELEIGLTLSTRDKIRYMDVIQNGQPVYGANLDEFKAAAGKLPPVKFTSSGWFLVRAITENTDTYRYATTAPYYVEVGYQPHISRKSAQLFLDWTNRRAEEIHKAVDAATADLTEKPPALTEILSAIDKAQKYWQDIAAKANAD